jgi:hypothetical protein
MNDRTATITAPLVEPAPAEISLQQKRLALGLISGCHVLNHLQYSITSVIFPVMMTELGFGLVGLGFISALSSFVGQGLQVIYGFLSNFFRRTTMLAVGGESYFKGLIIPLAASVIVARLKIFLPKCCQ